ncbi:MAG: VaFE repeat-containing surface-anchored protein, partial [Firmicutes bacterium]|nr:VaFE repeat-containing surface-anchored protein [Bacillota bacterium]
MSGDAFFLDSFGAPSVPAGTITVQETKAPLGYVINREVHTVRFTLREDGTVRSDSGTWNTANGLEDLSLVSEETAVYGGVRICKTDSVTGSSQSSIGTSLAGAEITVYNNCGKTITLKDGTRVADGAAVLTVRTAQDGTAQTAADALPYGKYYAKETASPAGYAVNTSWRADFSIKEQGTVTDASPVLSERPFAGALTVTKTDAEAGPAQGDASLSGIRFAVVNVSAKALRIGKAAVESGAVAAIISTDENGRASTAAGALPYGSYKVYELRSDASISVGDIYSGSDKLGSSALANSRGYRFREQSRSFSVDTDGQTVSAAFSDEVVKGIPEIIKTGEGGAPAQGNASLAGILFALVNSSAGAVKIGGNAYQKGTVVAVLTTGQDGKAKGEPLPYGTYTVYELREDASIAAGDTYEGSKKLGRSALANSKGFLFRDLSRTITIRKQGATVSVSFEDEVIKGGAAVVKTAAGGVQGDVSLEGVSFAVVNMSDAPVLIGGRTIEKGSVAAVITTDNTGRAETAPDCLPYGNYAVFELRSDASYEAGDVFGSPAGLGASPLANEGGLLFKEQSADVTISENGTVSEVFFEDEIVKGCVSIVKQDKDLEAGVPQGDASLEGIVFEIINRSAAAVTVDGASFEPGAAVMTIETDAKGTASSGAVLPFGTYEIREKAANGSYLLTDVRGRVFQIRGDGSIADASAGDEFRNEVIRGGVSFQKTDAQTGEPAAFGHGVLAGAEITVYNASENSVVSGGKEYAPGEAVLTLVTDENGRCATAADALPYGTYYALETLASEGYELNSEWRAEFRIRENGAVVDTAADSVLREERSPLEIRTSAADKISGGHTGAAAGADKVTIIDTVVMKGLLPGRTYTLTARLAGRDAEDPGSLVFLGSPVSLDFTTPEDLQPGEEWTEAPEIEADASEVTGKSVVVFESLEYGGVEIAVHADIDDPEQTVYYPEPSIRTTASDVRTEGHEGIAAGADVRITDVVVMSGLIAGKEYTLIGRLADRKASTGDSPVYIGEETVMTFTVPEGTSPEDSITETMEFIIPEQLLRGRTVVVFESLYSGETEVAVHADLSDGDQAVSYACPQLRTTAIDRYSGGHTGYTDGRTAVIADTVRITGIRGGEEYTVRGRLLDREASSEGTQAYIEGAENTVTFIAGEGETERTVEMTFTA